MVQGCKVSFLSNENMLILVIMVDTELSGYMKTIEWFTCTVYELYFKKAGDAEAKRKKT